MSLSTLIQNVTNKLGQKQITTVYGSSDNAARQYLALAEEVGRDLCERVRWPELEKEYTITLVADQASYALPVDFDRALYETHWDKTNKWPLIGYVSPQDWRQLKDGITSTGTRSKYRVKGNTDKQFFLDPTPGSGAAGDTIGFEYISTNWVRPQTWVSGTTFADGSYCFYDGNIYYASTGGTAGATAPTHTSGSASDDTISWAYQDIKYDSFLADTDVTVIDQQLIEKGVMLQWLIQQGLDASYAERDFELALKRKVNKKRGSRTLNHRGNPTFQFRLLSSEQVPNTGFGG